MVIMENISRKYLLFSHWVIVENDGYQVVFE